MGPRCDRRLLLPTAAGAPPARLTPSPPLPVLPSLPLPLPLLPPLSPLPLLPPRPPPTASPGTRWESGMASPTAGTPTQRSSAALARGERDDQLPASAVHNG
eukprot:TRINITY_DN8514_c0_g1_i3.p4 TRINITY_DN8514_c0_g1~~TRINITY_DN8514_c0_g1_i3.p4  ORF type:complete len:102 (-),score=28.59 TRINITY_DN8514_c0_g1_i3:61-366(-)